MTQERALLARIGKFAAAYYPLQMRQLLAEIGVLLAKPPAKPTAYLCPAGCGCLWRDNQDGTMSLYGPNSKSCAACEKLPLAELIPVYAKPTTQHRLTDDEIRTILLAGGFEIKPGFDDLKPYVYEAVRALEDALIAKNPAPVYPRPLTDFEKARGITPDTTPSSRWHQEGEPDPHGTSYDYERADLFMGHLTDDELANAVFLHGDVYPDIQDVIARKAFMPIAYLTAAKDRIRWLSRALEREIAKRKEAV